MTLVPYSRLFCGKQITIAVSGGHVCVLSSATGDIISQCSILKGTGPKETKTKGPIIAAAINEDDKHLATVGENKILSIWQLPALALMNERELPKRPTELAFTKDSQTILVSDKFGDVFSYPFDFAPPKTKPDRDEFSSHENPSDGQLILGHASPLNAFLLSHDEKYIITADRDEHIRVSWYPQGYNIEMYCLGHRKYVSAIHIPKYATETLISGGGDSSLKMWNWILGQCTDEIEIWDIVEPFVAVKNDKQRPSEEGQDEGGAQKRKGKGKKSKKRANKKATLSKDAEDQDQDEGAQNDEGELREAIDEKVLVVSKIDSIQSGERKFVLFCAVGVTALFVFQYPSSSIEYCDFGHPVIDFTLDPNGGIWVSLDINRDASGIVSPCDGASVRFTQLTETGKLVETAKNQALLRSLNEKVPRDTQEKMLDFYADLKGMPKWSGSLKQGAGEDEVVESISGSQTPKPLTRREEARMKNKKNVIAKMQMTSAIDKSKTGTVRSIENVEKDDAEERPETKRSRLVVKSGNGDVNMGM